MILWIDYFQESILIGVGITDYIIKIRKHFAISTKLIIISFIIQNVHLLYKKLFK